MVFVRNAGMNEMLHDLDEFIQLSYVDPVQNCKTVQ